MWLLVKLNDGITKYLISENKSYTVGRKNCDIVLGDDASVSRKHCTFHVAKVSESPVSILTRVWIVDEQSKYGTFLRSDNAWMQLNANERRHLTNGSVIKFGLLENNWRLEYKPIIACVSGVPVEQKKKIETILESVDSCLKSTWCKECSLVVVNEITLTVKVVLALINGIPIVTPVYLEKVAEAVKNQTEFPSYKNYQPVIKESILDKSLVSLDTKNHRKELFKGKKFIIPTKKQLETLKDVIISAGGTVELLSSTLAQESFADNDVIVIQLPYNNNGISKELIKSFKNITSFLKSNYGKRVIPESEIAQAVAYSSVEKFCNPKSTCFNLRIGERKQLDLGPLLVEETPSASEEKNFSQPGMVFASATFDSESALNRNTDLHSSADKTIESQCPPAGDIPVKTQQEPQKSLSQRKRTHNSNLTDQETPNKKARNPDSAAESSWIPKETSANDQAPQDKYVKNVGNASAGKSADDASSSGTDSSRGQNELLFEKVRVAKQSSNEFWNCEITHKRKTSTERQDSNEDFSRKKAKLSEPSVSKQKTAAVSAETVQKNNKTTISFPSPRKIRNVAEEDDFSDYFGKETSDADIVLEDLNNTILSLTIIPPSFLKEDGSLIEPPEVPVNVKRFKKQKIAAPVFNPLEEDDLSDGEWLEPHSNRLNISVQDGDEY